MTTPNGDAWHHESHVDKWYSLHDAAAVLDQLDEFEETDSGLWEGLGMKAALAACAAYTYGNAVYNEWREKIQQINQEASIIIDDFDLRIADLEDDDASEEDDPPAGRAADKATLEEEKKEVLRKMIESVADTPDPNGTVHCTSQRRRLRAHERVLSKLQPLAGRYPRLLRQL